MASTSDINSIQKKYIPVPFANGASAAYVNNIPQTRASGDPQNKATWNAGFPPITMQPVNADGTGGIPPSGADMNGVLNTLSSHAYTAQYGVSYDWDSNIASNLGGYPSGAIVAYPVGNNANKTLYLSLQENNTSIPTSGVWKKMYQDYIIDYGSSGAGWYQRYNSGWCIQGGQTVAKDHFQDYESILLPYSYINSSYNVIVSINVNEVKYISGSMSCYANKVSSSKFNIVFDATNNILGNSYATWRTEGYIS